jgi:hypothetical protein
VDPSERRGGIFHPARRPTRWRSSGWDQNDPCIRWPPGRSGPGPLGPPLSASLPRINHWQPSHHLRTIALIMACPFFMPTTKSDAAFFLHPTRLPLGGAWDGHCTALAHENSEPTGEELRNCNLGYASACSRLPQDRSSDAVRFSVARDCGPQLTLWFVYELDHRPAGHGTLEFDLSLGTWTSPHTDPRVQKMAECYLQSYLQRTTRPATAGFSSSPNS